MLRRPIVTLLLLITVTAVNGPTATWAAQQNADSREIAKDRQSLEAGKSRIKQLSHLIDLWHDANLKGDQSKIDQLAQQLEEMLHRDMDATARAISQAQAEKARSAREFHRGHRHWSEKVDDKRDLSDDIHDADQLRETLKVKKRLAASISKSPAFSNRYRLLGDYMDVMRHEVGMTRLELAEDIGELDQDR
ncbi:MAG: hypothetical protein ABIE70_05305 [bacterium]